MVRNIRGKNIADAEIAKGLDSLLIQMELSDKFQKATHSQRISELPNAKAEGYDISRLIDLHGKTNILQAAGKSLGPVASGVATYLKFCHQIDAIPCPPKRGRSPNGVHRLNREKPTVCTFATLRMHSAYWGALARG